MIQAAFLFAIFIGLFMGCHLTKLSEMVWLGQTLLTYNEKNFATLDAVDAFAAELGLGLEYNYFQEIIYIDGTEEILHGNNKLECLNDNGDTVAGIMVLHMLSIQQCLDVLQCGINAIKDKLSPIQEDYITSFEGTSEPPYGTVKRRMVSVRQLAKSCIVAARTILQGKLQVIVDQCQTSTTMMPTP